MTLWRGASAAMTQADEVRVARAFSAHSASPSRAGWPLTRERDKRLELMISPVISEEDRDAIEAPVTTPEEVAQTYADLLFEEARLPRPA